MVGELGCVSDVDIGISPWQVWRSGCGIEVGITLPKERASPMLFRGGERLCRSKHTQKPTVVLEVSRTPGNGVKKEFPAVRRSVWSPIPDMPQQALAECGLTPNDSNKPQLPASDELTLPIGTISTPLAFLRPHDKSSDQ